MDSYAISSNHSPTDAIEWSPLFTYHGFQFVRIDGWPQSEDPPTLQTLVAQEIRNDVSSAVVDVHFQAIDETEPDGEVHSNSDFLLQLHNLVRQSLLSNMHSIESDCPTRERVGWTGDAQVSVASTRNHPD